MSTAPGPGGGPEDLSAKMPLFAELQKLLAGSQGPVNWELARQVAIRTAAEVGEGSLDASGLPGLALLGAGGAPLDPSADTVEEAERRACEDALRLADIWLDPVTGLPSGLTRPPEAWSRVRWVEVTLPAWRNLCDPVAAQVVSAMGGSLSQGLGQLRAGNLPPELAAALPADLGAALEPMMGIMSHVGGLMFGAQLGQALGTLAREVLSGSDIGLPLAPDGVAALIPANLAAFGEGLMVSPGDVRVFVALREAAHQRLFGHVPWLRSRLFAAVEEYARGIRVDPEALGRAVTAVNPAEPESLQRALTSGVFDPEPTPEQRRTLERLETLLALVEGWVDEVVASAATPLPAAAALQESVRRRRAAGGPAEQTFTTLVGLDLRPRRFREAAALWRRLAEDRGVEGRDRLWEHPDLLPSGEDLADPQAFLSGTPLDLTDLPGPAEPPAPE